MNILPLKKAKCEAAAQRRPVKIERKNRVFSAKRQAVWFETPSVSNGKCSWTVTVFRLVGMILFSLQPASQESCLMLFIRALALRRAADALTCVMAAQYVLVRGRSRHSFLFA